MDFGNHESGAEIDKADYKARRDPLRIDLLNLQTDLAASDLRVLVVVIGDDRAGCEEVVDRLNNWLDARGIDTEVFVEPNDGERARPAAWRYWNALPLPGRIGVFLGAWAYDYLSARLSDAPKKARKRALRRARATERILVDEGTLLLRYWIHTPRKVLEQRLDDTKKVAAGWRAAARDREVLERYKDVVAAGEEFVDETNDVGAPWEIVEGSDARLRDLTVLEHLRGALTERLESDVGEAATTAGLEPLDPEQARPLERIDLGARMEREEYEERLEELQARLADLAYLASERGQPAALVFEGPDAAGKGGAIRRITKAVAARDYRVFRISAPSELELAHPYLWRFWQRIPRRGRLGLFDRSWYGRVLVERVEGYASEDDVARAYGEIVEFERQLRDEGWIVAKFWLHIDSDEQLRRFEARKNTPYKKYKLTDEDYRNRGKWDAYFDATNEMIARTDTPRAPWHVVPANDKLFARCTVLEEVCRAYAEALEP